MTIQTGATAIFRNPQNMGPLTLQGNAVATAATGGTNTLHVQSLSMNASSTFNLNDNDLVVESGSFSAIRSLVLTGFGTPGPGITSGTATGSQILALFDNALVGSGTWNGAPIGTNAIVGKYTYFGDANIDGQVTGDDYTVIDANLNTTPASVSTGSPVT
jgi:hypothetical protein